MSVRCMRSFAVAAAMACSFALSLDAQSETIGVKETTQIPGASLRPATYSFSIEDRMSDRAIVRITDPQNSGTHYLLLSVPNKKLTASGSLMFFKKGDGQALRAWKCSTCSAPLEFVYPKLEAVKITDTSTEPVLAVDPTYDKLPENLSQDDMKVVTLWLLTPERVTADHVGEGVKAAKYSAGSAPQQLAANTPRHRLPKTASNFYTFEVAGMFCLLGGYAVRRRRLART